MISFFRLLLWLRRLQKENAELRALVKEIYVWTDHKNTRWARRAREALDR